MTSCVIENDVAIISLDEGKANAVGHSLIDGLCAGLDQAESQAKAVLIRGKAGMFSAGFDLKEFEKGEDATAKLVARGTEIFLRLFMHPQPVVAECTGHAVAAGAFILLTCDTRLGAHGEFKIGLNETAIGFSLPVFGLEFAKARLSKRHIQAAVIQSELYEPTMAQEVGYLDSVHEPAALHDAAMKSAVALGKLPAKAYGENKRGLRANTAKIIQASMA